MSMELHILSDRRLVTSTEWQRAIATEKYPLRLQAGIDLLKLRGFLPAWLDEKNTGFECFEDDASSVMTFLGPEKFDRHWRFALGLRWLGSKLDELQAAWMAAVAYASATEGIIFGHEEGKAFTPELARDVVRNIDSDAVKLDALLKKIEEQFSRRK